jgi:oxaloacetate decarboxylase alpha subunit
MPLIKQNIGDVPLEFHAHCNNGMAPFNYLEAIKLGVDTLHTGIPPLANGFGQPSIFNVARNAAALGYRPVVDLEAVKPVENHFTFIGKREGHPVGAQREYDHSQYLHQVPGGMISNLRFQLRAMGMENKMQETLEECGRVRAEFGYPIMVTPLAQFVGSQAAINVITGERYKEVTDQAIQYALGHWGKEAREVMDVDVKDKILSRPRAKEWQNWAPSDLSLQEVRKKFGGAGVSDEELVLRVIAGEAAVKAMLAAGAPKEYLSVTQPLVRLIGELSKRKDCNQVFIEKKGLTLRLGKKPSEPQRAQRN